MKNLKTLEEFLNESYGGPVGVTFNKINFAPLMTSSLYVNLNNEIVVLDFRGKTWESDSTKKWWDKFDKFTKNFNTKSIEKNGYRKLILDGYYEVSDANNRNSELKQYSNKDRSDYISFIVYTGLLKEGKIEYGDPAD